MKVPLYQVHLPLRYDHVLPDSYKEAETLSPEIAARWEELRAKAKKHGFRLNEIPSSEKFKSNWYQSCLETDSVWLDGGKTLELLADFECAKITQKVEVELDPKAIFEQVSSKAEAAFVGGTAIYNSKCDVHMPGQALSTYNEVCLLEDSCTDVLQAKLAEGWRIIAGCPQPNQRRPDYILGRFNPNYNGHDSAVR